MPPFLPFIGFNERLVKRNETFVEPDERLESPFEALKRFFERLVEVNERLKRFDEPLERFDERLKRFDERLNGLFGPLKRFNERLVEVDEALERSCERLKRLDERLKRFDERIVFDLPCLQESPLDSRRMENRPRRLCWHGMLLFLLGLITGLVVQQLRNPRMGLAAHLEGLMNGTFLLALGAAWSHVRLSPRAARAAFGTALYGTYANWASTTIAAAFGTAAMTPLASGIHKGQSWQEVLVAFGFGSVALAMLISSALLLWGLRKT